MSGVSQNPYIDQLADIFAQAFISLNCVEEENKPEGIITYLFRTPFGQEVTSALKTEQYPKQHFLLQVDRKLNERLPDEGKKMSKIRAN